MTDSLSKEIEVENLIPNEGILGGYMSQLEEMVEIEPDKKRAAIWVFSQLRDNRGLEILKIISGIEGVCREMETAVNELSGRNLGLVILLTVEHLATTMKPYVIAWSTLLDLLAYLINEVFDLGIAEKDVKLQLSLNNRHVQNSRIPQVIKEYENASVLRDLKKRRNDLVHRGKIPDVDIEKMLAERNMIDSRRYSLFKMNPISEEEYKAEKSLFQEKLWALGKQKQEVWEKHREQTIVMLSEIGRELAHKRFGLYQREKIRIPPAEV